MTPQTPTCCPRPPLPPLPPTLATPPHTTPLSQIQPPRLPPQVAGVREPARWAHPRQLHSRNRGGHLGARVVTSTARVAPCRVGGALSAARLTRPAAVHPGHRPRRNHRACRPSHEGADQHRARHIPLAERLRHVRGRCARHCWGRGPWALLPVPHTGPERRAPQSEGVRKGKIGKRRDTGV